MFQRFIIRMRSRCLKVLGLLILLVLQPVTVHADCKDPALRKQVADTAKAEGVDENELLSIIAHESRCHFNVIAWNLPRRPETAKSKFFDSLDEAKKWAEELIATKQYRVDVGIGQINNEAHIQPKGWTLDEVLNPETALNRVAQVLKERGWEHYHSNNPVYAERWKKLALAALGQVLGREGNKLQINHFSKNHNTRKVVSKTNLGEMLVFNRFDLQKKPEAASGAINNDLVIYRRL